MEISIQDRKIQIEILQGVADISRLICRFAVFEETYLQDQSSLHNSLKVKLATTLKTLYMAVLRYLVEVTLHLSYSSPGKLSNSSLCEVEPIEI